ncbi:MAG: hypothetical protein RLZZ444_3494 [Pseudomonadota bacterium]
MERRAGDMGHDRVIGYVIACDGAHATVASTSRDSNAAGAAAWSVGKLISIAVGSNRVIAMTRSMRAVAHSWNVRTENTFEAELELLGEIRCFDDGSEQFSTGISTYPILGSQAHLIRATDLEKIYDRGALETCVIGSLSQDEKVDAAIHIPSLLSKHFAIVGSTGTGKSTAVSLLLNKMIDADSKLRILILDPHNEFAAAFPERAQIIDTDNLDLPFWLFRLDEFAEVIFRGRPPVPEELDVLRDLIPEAKKSFRGSEPGNRRPTDRNGMTADTPVPYRIADLLALIDDRIGRLEGRTEKPVLRSLKLRLVAAVNDPRYHFMFSSNTITDTILDTIATIFRIPGQDRPISTFQLAGIPSEVVNSVASVLCRMAFEVALWSNGAIHILVVCEEAHRYVPSDPSLGFLPTRLAIARIAKEGRKYGASLGMITQRPGELDQTILSQCSTIFSMRLSNDHDQAIIRKALPGASLSAMNFLSSLANGEAIAFGEALPVPMRLKFVRVAENKLPRAHGAEAVETAVDPASLNLGAIVSRMRAGTAPDISDFQSRIQAAEASLHEAVFATTFDEFGPTSAPESTKPPAAGTLPAYSPSMLPGTLPLDDETDALSQRLSRYGSLLRNDRAPTSSPDLPQRSPGEPPTQNQSLRESLFRKPGSGLFKR